MNASTLNQEKLFFIIGSGRSGTSLFQSIMNSFDGFCNDKEARIGRERISCYGYVIKNGDFNYLEEYIRTNWTDEFFVEKTPNSILCLPQLHERYPNANYLFLERNPSRIILSMMNLHPPGRKDEEFRKQQLFVGNITNDDLKLNYEQLKADMLLKRVKLQIENKPKFNHQMTVRYENFVTHLEDNIRAIQEKFKISANIDLAKKIIMQPSRGSRKNRYDIKKLTDKFAIEWIKQACVLWNYDYEDPATNNQNL